MVSETPKMKLWLTTTGSWKHYFNNAKHVELRSTRCSYEVPFMGHIFSKEDLKIDPSKAKAVLEMMRPKDVEGVQRLNGFVNYLAKTKL